jgi:hypothetical protein
VAPRVKFPKLETELYRKIVLNDLVVFAVYFLDRQGGEVAAEDIISACFRLFPRRFSLKHYPRWPDSAVVSRHWSLCRSRGLLRGTVAQGFSLTYKGMRLAVRLEKKLGLAKPAQVKKVRRPERTKERIEKVRKPAPQKKPLTAAPRKPPVKVRRRKQVTPGPVVHAAPAVKVQTPQEIVSKETRVKAGKFVRMMERSDAFLQYRKNGGKSRISEFDFRSVLLCTMESSPETLARNLELFKGYAAIHKRQDLVAFLQFCGEGFSSLLKPRSGRTPVKLHNKRR